MTESRVRPLDEAANSAEPSASGPSVAGARRWSAGDRVVVRNLARSDGGVTMALPTLVIQDDDAVLALYVPPGTIAKDNYVVPASQRVEAVGSTPPSRERRHVDRVWAAPSIRLYLPGEAFSVWLFFSEQGDFAGWYGNLESPYVRTPLGIDTRDHALDVVADPQGRWRWKDEAEFARRLETGLDLPEHQNAVRAAGHAFISRLELKATPFDQGWSDWRAPANWRAPSLPSGWAADLGTAARLR